MPSICPPPPPLEGGGTGRPGPRGARGSGSQSDSPRRNAFGPRLIEPPKVGRKYPKMGSSAGIPSAATPERPAHPKVAHAAIADHGLVPDFAKGSDPFVRLVAAGHSIAVAYESLHPDAKARVSVHLRLPRQTLVEGSPATIPSTPPPAGPAGSLGSRRIAGWWASISTAVS